MGEKLLNLIYFVLDPVLLTMPGLKRYLALPQPEDKVQCMYIWIDGSGENLRAKTRTVETVPKDPKKPAPSGWNFDDGSSTGQAEGKNSDVMLHPLAAVNDPFQRRSRGGSNKLSVLCETCGHDGGPLPQQQRGAPASRPREFKPWFRHRAGVHHAGHRIGHRVRAGPRTAFPGRRVPTTPGSGARNVYGKATVVESHYRACMYAGVKYCRTNAEVMPAQWEFQVGPCEGIDMGDHLWLGPLPAATGSRGLRRRRRLLRPKPMPGDWNGAGAHTNFSTLRCASRRHEGHHSRASRGSASGTPPTSAPTTRTEAPTTRGGSRVAARDLQHRRLQL
uniref:glutamine synthetase n=1 Tax=Macrostomum lignano TaxID=282301 RepID=A0A1I8F6V9_9PLAT